MEGPRLEARLENAGLRYEVGATIALTSGDFSDGLIVSQDPAPTAEAAAGARVHVAIGDAAAAPESLSIVIRWGGEADFDLTVVEPNGTQISSSSGASSTGGEHSGDYGTCSEGEVEFGSYESVWWTTSPALIELSRTEVRPSWEGFVDGQVG